MRKQWDCMMRISNSFREGMNKSTACNKIYDKGYSQNVMILEQIKQKTKKFEDYRTLSLISCVAKIIPSNIKQNYTQKY